MVEQVVFVDPSGRGGIGHYTYCLAREMARAGTEVTLLTSDQWEFAQNPSGIDVRMCFQGYKTRPWAIRREFERVSKNGVVAVHWQSTTHPILLWLLQSISCSSLNESPWVFTVHNVLPHEIGWLDKLTHSMLYKRMNGLIFHGLTSRNRFQRLFSLNNRRWVTIPHGEYVFHFENKPVPGPNLEEKNILFFGNVRKYKGLIYLLRAFQLVREQVPGARLLIVGQALEDFTPYQKEIDLLGMAKDVDVELRYVSNDEVPDIFSRATVVALPYTDVYQSGVLLLAYGAGIPVVASDVGDLSEAIRDQETGLLVPPAEVPALRDALITLLQNPEKCSEMGRNARQLADTEYNWKHIAEKTLEFYRTLRPKNGKLSS